MELHFLHVVVRISRSLKLNYNTSPCNCFCPVFSMGNNIFFEQMVECAHLNIHSQQQPQKLGVLWEQP